MIAGRYHPTPGSEQLPPFCSQRAPEPPSSRMLIGAPTSAGCALISKRISRSIEAADPTLRSSPEFATYGLICSQYPR